MMIKILLVLMATLCAQLNAVAATVKADALVATTDGEGLLPKPPGMSRVESQALYEQGIAQCDAGCVTPFGAIMGTVDGVDALSNCQSSCIRPEYSFMHLQTKAVSVHANAPRDPEQHYVGLIYQCVEYARRWWMSSLGITFGSIDSAYEIMYLTEGKRIHTGAPLALARSVNGTAKKAPKRGDLLIYNPMPENPHWRYGHVAVVVGVDHERGLVSLAEQNYSNQPWQQPDSFSRQIKMFKIGGRYQLVDLGEGEHQNSAGGLISGWVYPAVPPLN